MAFNENRRINVSGWQNNCGANVLLHALIDHWDFLDFSQKPYNELLTLFSEAYPLAPTMPQMKAAIDSVPNSIDREIAFGPIIRQHIAKTLQANQYYRETIFPAFQEQNDFKGNFNEYCRLLGDSSNKIEIAANELHCYAQSMGINLEIYCKGKLLGNPAGIADNFSLKLLNNGAHYEYEAAAHISDQIIQKRRTDFIHYNMNNQALFSEAFLKPDNPEGKKAIYDHIIKSRLQPAAVAIPARVQAPAPAPMMPMPIFPPIKPPAPLVPAYDASTTSTKLFDVVSTLKLSANELNTALGIIEQGINAQTPDTIMEKNLREIFAR